MHEMTFEVLCAQPQKFATTPTLALKLRIALADPQVAVENVLLQCQIRIEPTRRPYTSGEQAWLADLFGDPGRWGETVRAMLWTHVGVTVPSFSSSTEVDLLVPCSFDFNAAATKYFYGVEEGEVPLILLFSGTVFYRDEDQSLRMTRINWSAEARYRLSVAVWKEMMDHYYPNTAWLCLDRDVFDRLYRHKLKSGLPTFEQALSDLLAHVDEPAETSVPARLP